MSTLRARRNTFLALAALALVGLLLWFWPTRGDEQAPLRVVNEVLAAVEVKPDETPGKRDQRLQKVLDSHFEDPVTVRHVDMPRAGAGRRALLIWGRLLGAHASARLSAEQVQVGLSDDRSAATVRLTVTFDAENKAGERVEDQRVVDLRLRRQRGVWKIQRVDVQAGAHDVPEARP